MMNNIEFACANSLQGNSEFQSHATAILGNLLDLAPSDAALLAGVEEKDNGFLASVQIKSVNYSFESFALESDPFLALTTVQGDTRAQLSRWKSSRA